MSEARFDANLDALVRGEHLTSDDDLTRFVADLYGEEQNMTMPHALKQRITGGLGLPAAQERTSPAPVSRRTLRSAEPASRRNRSWVMPLAIAAALVLVLASVIRWGLPNGNDDGENLYLMSTPAVPTISASPAALPDDESSWMQPLSVVDCSGITPVDQPEVSAEDFDALPAPQAIIAGPADPADAFAANETARMFMACAYPESLVSERYATESTLAGEQFSPINVVALDRQFQDGMELSAQFEEAGVTPEDTMLELEIEPSDVADPNTVSPFPNPTFAFVLEDGRIAIPAFHQPGNPQATIGTSLILVNENGSWVVDDLVPVCLGDCDSWWARVKTIYRDALWLSPIAPEECETNAYLPADLTEEQSAAVMSRQYLACEESSDASPLQGPDYRVTDGEDARSLSEEIETLHRANGQQSGSLQRIADSQQLESMGIDLPDEPWAVYQPDSVVTLADGRIAVLQTTVVTPEILSGSGRTSPVVTTALVWEVDGDTWLLDEEVDVCLGNCDSFWGDDAESVATPAATSVEITVPETCEESVEFRADFASHERLPVQLRPGPGAGTGFADVISPGTPLQYLCESEPTTSPTVDRMEEGQVWLHVISEDGSEGWIREVDLRPVD